jgi:putative transposase
MSSQRLLADQGVSCGMRRKGHVWDNSAMESFFFALKIERVNRSRYRTREQGRPDIFLEPFSEW